MKTKLISIVLLPSFVFFVSCQKPESRHCVGEPCICIYKYKNPEYKDLCLVGGEGNFIEYHKIDTNLIKGPEYLIPTLYDPTAPAPTISKNGYIIERGAYMVCSDDKEDRRETGNVGIFTENIYASGMVRISSVSKKDFIEKKLPYDTIPKTIIDEDPFEEFYFEDTYNFHKTVKDVKEFLDKGGDINELGFTRLKLRK